MNRNWTKIDAADELRRIGPQIAAAIRELDRLCERLPQDLVGRIEAAAPEIVHFDHQTGLKLSQLAQQLDADIAAMPDDEYEAMMQAVEARRRADRQRQSTIPFQRLETLQSDRVLGNDRLKPGRPPALMDDDGPDGEAA